MFNNNKTSMVLDHGVMRVDRVALFKDELKWVP